MLIKKLVKHISDHSILIITVSLIFGIVFARQSLFLAPYTKLFLGSIFFLSALKIDMKEVKKYLHQSNKILLFNLKKLIILPILVYSLTFLVSQELALAFLILAAMPAGMTTPVLSEILGGKQSLSLVLTISSSLLAVFTIPLIVNILASTSLSVGLYDMFYTLATIILIPFALAEIVKYFFDKKLKDDYFIFTPISIILLALINIGIAAKQSGMIISGFKEILVTDFILLFALFVIFHLLGYFLSAWRSTKERITSTISLTYINYVLAIFLASDFFESPRIITMVVLSIIPWVVLLSPFEHILERYSKSLELKKTS